MSEAADLLASGRFKEAANTVIEADIQSLGDCLLGSETSIRADDELSEYDRPTLALRHAWCTKKLSNKRVGALV